MRILSHARMFFTSKLPGILDIVSKSLRHLFEQVLNTLLCFGVYHSLQTNMVGMIHIAALRLQRHCMRRHDYKAMVHKLIKVKSQKHLPLIFVYLLVWWFSDLMCLSHLPTQPERPMLTPQIGGGACTQYLSSEELLPHVHPAYQEDVRASQGGHWMFKSHTKFAEASQATLDQIPSVVGFIPFNLLIKCVNAKELRQIGGKHNVKQCSKKTRNEVETILMSHECDSQCMDYSSTFISLSLRKRPCQKNVPTHPVTHTPEQVDMTPEPTLDETTKKAEFPPKPPTLNLLRKIINGFVADTSPAAFMESGCACCGLLKPLKSLSPVKEIKCSLSPLVAEGVTQKERRSSKHPIEEIPGPVLDPTCDKICSCCLKSLEKGRRPSLALANGFWIGQVPKELSDLTYAEKLLVARIRHNRCIIKVASGRYKMRANAIMFKHPTPKIYQTLPPPSKEFDEVLAVIYTGPCKPTPEDVQRTPFLVRRNTVKTALNWLKLNHSDYHDLVISDKNLEEYPENAAPVCVTYKDSVINRDREAMSLDDTEDEVGTESGPCSFSVQGLVGEEFSNMSLEAMKASALNHLVNNGKIMFVGHAGEPESLFRNDRLFPSMLPWLFPYGKGAIGQLCMKNKMSEDNQKQHLLMYHDKRFQTDPMFPLLAFNQSQIQQSSLNSYLLAKKNKFAAISHRLHSLDLAVLESITKRLAAKEIVRPETDAEKQCFQILNDLDAVNGTIKNSVSSKKYMRNEIWSLISYLGAPAWFITLSPADNKHPICLYLADNKVEFKPEIRLPDDAYRLIANNPVAAARFFHMMCQSFIKNVLGVDKKHPGLYGKTSGYYGTVEQQGRLTLHLHLLLWIENSLSPQEMRNHIMDKTSTFQKDLIQYLESVHQGQLQTGTIEEVRNRVIKAKKEDPSYKDPTQTLPVSVPVPLKSNKQQDDTSMDQWWENYDKETDDILTRSNIHSCHFTVTDKAGVPIRKGCLNESGVCKARFPRETFRQTVVDPLSGALRMKKGEAWMNTFSRPVSYLFRCNSDTTSLLSGTAIKAIVRYVTDYVTKPGLSTYSIFESVKQVISKSSEVLGGTYDQQQTSRSLLTKMVNNLTAKMEIGSPLACLYLLKHPDHYTQHTFVPFYWKNYVREVETFWNPSQAEEEGKKVVLNKQQGKIIGTSNVDDYIQRPQQYENINLYTWARLAQKDRISKKALEDHLTFEPMHPQHHTHCVKLGKENSLIVPNFLGGHLPRRDIGDYEYYCLVMLTLFKPWRTGSSLKKAQKSWSETFASHTFSNRENQLMTNFNLLYECNDARDDYSAQLRSQSKGSNEIPDMYLDDTNQRLLQEDDAEYTFGEPELEVPVEPFFDEDHTSTYYSKIEDMMKMSKRVIDCGWISDTHKSSSKDASQLMFSPPTNMTAADWKNVVQQTRKALLQQTKASITSFNKRKDQLAEHEGEVVVDDQSYLFKESKNVAEERSALIGTLMKKWKLNKEQQRAFSIVASHASLHSPQQLKMYLGGKGGTGKSQVLKALIDFFDLNNEKHRILVLAPTGTAAALLKGSTYHSALGIRSESSFAGNEHTTIAQLKSRLEGVDYIFLDEVSMVSCMDMYRISAQMAKICNMYEKPFGGMNIIFAGDFAQLPPVNAQSLYSGAVGVHFDSSMTEWSQKNAIGKALWHQITTVVILRQNMRQSAEGSDESKLRQALSNMRYAACTKEDIDYLESKIVNRGKNSPDLTAKHFENVPIITALNTHKDTYNRLGSQQFADQTNQTLQDFYSVDTQQTQENLDDKRKRAAYTTKLSPKLQNEIWNLSPAFTENIPGKMSLCHGLPVMIRNNDATELCITKGQEGHVVSWQSSIGPNGQPVLDTVFVKLSNPAKTINIPNLPENVVPLSRIKSYVVCKKAGRGIRVCRSQVPIVPNFGITDYASQGKTRPSNIVDITDCRTSMACYVALSRGTSAERTAILRPFSSAKLTSKISGYLRQEFRELELLDEVTRLIHEGNPSFLTKDSTRHTVLKNYRTLKGPNYCPKSIDPPLQWSKADPMMDTEMSKLVDHWDVDTSSKKKKQGNKIMPSVGFVPAEGSKPLAAPKRKRDDSPPPAMEIKKKTKVDHSLSSPQGLTGLTWDAENYSCAYDALLTLLFNLWLENPDVWSKIFSSMSRRLKTLTSDFKKVINSDFPLQDVRDRLRVTLNQNSSQKFPYGKVGTDIGELCSAVFKSNSDIISSVLICNHCNNQAQTQPAHGYMEVLASNDRVSLRQLVSSSQDHQTKTRCPDCRNYYNLTKRFIVKPKLLLYNIHSQKVRVSKKVIIQLSDGTSSGLSLRGIIYLGDYHFVARFIDSSKKVWFHDGITTADHCHLEGDLSQFTEMSLKNCKNTSAVMAIYAG